jgi:hypothetical protein
MPNSKSQQPAAGASGPVNAAGTHLNYYGGPVVLKPSVYLIFWGPQWGNGATDGNQVKESQTATYVQDFFKGVGGSPWLNSVTQYCQDFNPLDLDPGPRLLQGAGQRPDQQPAEYRQGPRFLRWASELLRVL